MKAAFISALAAFVGLAAAEASCSISDMTVQNVAKREDCSAAMRNIVENPDEEFTTHGCYGLGCEGGCEISVCGNELTLKRRDIAGAVEDILNTCAPEPGQSFQGESPSGEATVKIYKPDVC